MWALKDAQQFASESMLEDSDEKGILDRERVYFRLTASLVWLNCKVLGK